jgi:hypothetical protein
MPTVTFGLDHAGRPVIELYVGVASAEQDTSDTPEPTPPPVRVRALLDTGASLFHLTSTRLVGPSPLPARGKNSSER